MLPQAVSPWRSWCLRPTCLKKWDAADAVDEEFDCVEFIRQAERRIVKAAPALLPTFTLGALLDDLSPLPPDLISPRVLTPGGLLVFGGAPKVGKSDFLLSWLTHMAAGATFLGRCGRRACGSFTCRPRCKYHYLRERVKEIQLPPHRLLDARVNFVATPQLRMVLDDAGLEQVIPAIANAFGGLPPTSLPSTRSAMCSMAGMLVARTTTVPCCISCRSAWIEFVRR